MPVECNWVGDYEDPAKLNRESRRGECRRVECICVCVHLPKSLLDSVKCSLRSVLRRDQCVSECVCERERSMRLHSFSLILSLISITEERNKRG